MSYRFALAVLCSVNAWAAAPSYTAGSIVNAANYAPGPFAPNTIVALFGTELSYLPFGASSPIATLEDDVGATRVYLDNIPAPLLYVSATQLNFLIPATQSLGSARVRVVRESISGPEVTLTIGTASPGLFGADGYAIATHADNSLMNAASPAHAGEIVVIYATGLGKTSPDTSFDIVAPFAAQIATLSTLRITLAGIPVDPILVKYAGVTPRSAGLYQINLEIPQNPGADPEIRVTVAGQTSPPGLKLAIR